MKKILACIAMVIATVIWGTAFSAQSEGAGHVGALLFVALRSFVGAAALSFVILLSDLARRKRFSLWGDAVEPQAKKDLLCGGLFCGIAITAASSFQQLGIRYVSAGKTGFLTALYILIVPLLGLFLRKKTPKTFYAASCTALLGTYLLCGGVDSFGKGEFFVLLCAFLFAGHIMVIDHYAARCDCLRLSCVQFFVAAILSLCASLLFGEKWLLSGIRGALPYWLFCGVGSSAIAFTLQIVAQKYLHPVLASLLMSLESVFAVAGGYLFLHEQLSGRELAGCVIILLSIVFAQIPWKGRKVEESQA